MIAFGIHLINNVFYQPFKIMSREYFSSLIYLLSRLKKRMKKVLRSYARKFANEIHGRYFAEATLDSGAETHSTGLYFLTNIKKKKLLFEGVTSEIVSEFAGDLKLGGFNFKSVSYLPSIKRTTILSLSAITENGFQIRLDRKGGEIIKDGINVVSFPKLGRDWVIRASDATKKLTFEDPLECSKSVENHKTKIEDPVASEFNFATLSNTQKFWAVDSGLCTHSVIDERKLMNKRKCLYRTRDVSGSWKVVEVVGDVQFGSILLKNVAFSPTSRVNLISVHELAEEGYEFYFTNETVVFILNGKEVYSAPRVEGAWGVFI